MSSKGATLDMSRFFGTPEEKVQFCEELLALLKLRGCVKLQNHGIPAEDIHKLFDMTKKFFSLPHEQKMTIAHPPNSTPNRGYSYVGQENVANISGYEKGREAGRGTTRDIKETVDMGSATDSPVSNLWLEESILPGYRSTMESFYNKAFETEMHILSALAIALGLKDKDGFLSMHNRAENEFRILHYPDIPASELRDGSGATRIAEHTDFGTITMLFQDSTGGLQVEDQVELGTFRDVESEAATDIILNIGDSLQRLTNDTFMAACHRVTYPPTVDVDGSGEEKIPERYSIAYFAKPNRSASLAPLREFVSEERPCRYDDVTAWEWNNLRIQALYS